MSNIVTSSGLRAIKKPPLGPRCEVTTPALTKLLSTFDM
jgi:hypothetical protein